jgi:hypothetical protein
MVVKFIYWVAKWEKRTIYEIFMSIYTMREGRLTVRVKGRISGGVCEFRFGGKPGFWRDGLGEAGFFDCTEKR